ncbi:uncharacterized mitochondrial protein-like protein [Tanacetum coccineum]
MLIDISGEYYYADHMNAILGVYTDLDEVTNLQCDYLETREKCERLGKVLSKSRTMSKSFEALQKHAINLELDLQQWSNSYTSVSATAKSNHLEDRVMSNNSQGKKQEVEYHRRKFKTRQPMVVPINTREPKQTVNQSIATSSKKTVATDSTVKKFRNITRKLYEQVRQNACGVPLCPILHRLLILLQLVEIVLFIVDSGCSKHMTGNLKLLTNFVEKFLGTVKFGNDQIAPILGYGDLVQGTITIKRVYYVEGLNHNLFSVGQFCDADLEVAFRKSTCYIRDLKGNDLLKGSRGTDLYSITLQDSTTPNPICLMAKATSSQGWLSASTHFLRSKDETPRVLIDFLTLVQRGLHAQVTIVQTDKGTKFLNKTHYAYFVKEGIRHETSTARTPKQNGVVERRNRTLVEAAQTMISAAKVPLFFWAEAIATTCFTQNRSLVIPRHEKTPYHIINAGNVISSSFTSLVLFATSSEMMASDHVSSDPGPQCSTTVLEQDSLSPAHTLLSTPSSAQRWTKDHPLEQVMESFSNQLDKTSAWKLWQVVYLSTHLARLESCTVVSMRLLSQIIDNVQMDVTKSISLRTAEGRSVRKPTDGFVDQYVSDKVTVQEALLWTQTSTKSVGKTYCSWYDLHVIALELNGLQKHLDADLSGTPNYLCIVPQKASIAISCYQSSIPYHDIDVRYLFIMEQDWKKALLEDRFKYLLDDSVWRCLTPDEMVFWPIESA